MGDDGLLEGSSDFFLGADRGSLEITRDFLPVRKGDGEPLTILFPDDRELLEDFFWGDNEGPLEGTRDLVPVSRDELGPLEIAGDFLPMSSGAEGVSRGEQGGVTSPFSTGDGGEQPELADDFGKHSEITGALLPGDRRSSGAGFVDAFL